MKDKILYIDMEGNLYKEKPENIITFSTTQDKIRELRKEINKQKDLKNNLYKIVPNENGELYIKLIQRDEIEYLRHLREKKCFVYVDRGLVWYNMLSNEQMKELQEWYEAWLNVTDTEQIPTKPEWLK